MKNVYVQEYPRAVWVLREKTKDGEILILKGTKDQVYQELEKLGFTPEKTPHKMRMI